MKDVWHRIQTDTKSLQTEVKTDRHDNLQSNFSNKNKVKDIINLIINHYSLNLYVKNVLQNIPVMNEVPDQ